MTVGYEAQGYADEVGGLTIFPIFLVVDTSGSMGGARIAAANDMVPAILDVCMEDTSVADMLRLGVLSFDTSPRVEMPFGPAKGVVPPVLRASGLTAYGAAFDLARSEVETAIAGLRADGFRSVVRPTIFFVTDGQPTDDVGQRTSAFDALTASKYSPNVFAFGVGEAKIETLKQFTNKKGFAAVSKGEATEGLRKLIPMITQSIVQSVHAGEDGRAAPSLVIDQGDIDDGSWLFD